MIAAQMLPVHERLAYKDLRSKNFHKEIDIIVAC